MTMGKYAGARMLPVQQLQQRSSPLGGMLGKTAGAALGGALGAGLGPLGAKLGAQAGGALGGQLGGTGTINPQAAATNVLGQNQAGVTDWMRGAMGFNEGGEVPWWKKAYQRSEGRAMAPKFDSRSRGLNQGERNQFWNDYYGGGDYGRDYEAAVQRGKAASDPNKWWDNLHKMSQEDRDAAIMNFDPAQFDESKAISKEVEALGAAKQAELDAMRKQEMIKRAKPRKLGGVDWDIPLGSIGDVDFSTQGEYGMMKGAKDPYTVMLTGQYDWGGDDTPMAARRADEMSMEEYNRSGPEAAAADAQVAEMAKGMTEQEKRLMAMFNSAGGPITPQYKFLGGLLGAADKATRAADFVGGLSKVFKDRNDKLKGKKKKEDNTQKKNMGGPIAAPMGQSSFMMQHGSKFGEKVGPLAKTSYKSKGGEVWERSYHNPLMTKSMGDKK